MSRRYRSIEQLPKASRGSRQLRRLLYPDGRTYRRRPWTPSFPSRSDCHWLEHEGRATIQRPGAVSSHQAAATTSVKYTHTFIHIQTGREAVALRGTNSIRCRGWRVRLNGAGLPGPCQQCTLLVSKAEWAAAVSVSFSSRNCVIR